MHLGSSSFTRAFWKHVIPSICLIPLVPRFALPNFVNVEFEDGLQAGGTPSDFPPSIASAVPVTIRAASLHR
jgi:hypothetical protein